MPESGGGRRGPAPLVGRDLEELSALAVSLGEPAYRGRQIYRGLYRELRSGPGEILTLPRGLRSRLEGQFGGGLPPTLERCESADGAARYLLQLRDGRSVEAVFIPEEGRDTLCISTQVGCAVDCKFCLTAALGLERNLEAGEIVAQVLALARDRGLDAKRRPLNVVMMGMGEPLLNLQAVMKATRLLADPDGVAVPLRRITVSTSGIVPKIAEFGSYARRGKLAVSLNASSEEQRVRLMPVTAKYRLAALLEACRAYPLRPWERLTFEYVLLRDVNDSDRDARDVLRLLASLRCSVNLIALNPGPGIPFDTPEPARVESFRAIVHRGLPCFVRKPRGRDVFAACGQLKRTAAPPGEAAGGPYAERVDGDPGETAPRQAGEAPVA